MQVFPQENAFLLSLFFILQYSNCGIATFYISLLTENLPQIGGSLRMATAIITRFLLLTAFGFFQPTINMLLRTLSGARKRIFEDSYVYNLSKLFAS